VPNNSSEHDWLRASLERTRDCPPIEALESESAKAHVAGCAYCRTELAQLKSFQNAAIPAHDQAAVAQIAAKLRQQSFGPIAAARTQSWIERIFGAGWMRPAALVLASALVVVAIGLELRHRPSALDSKAGDRAPVYRSGAVVITSPLGDLQSTPGELVWEPVAGAKKYQVHLMEVDHHELWSADSADARIALPVSVREKLVPLKTFLLEVDAFDANGRKVAQSEIIHFRVLQRFYSH
jgi:hypothetical protein